MSEAHDVDSIAYWLNKWKKAEECTPLIAVVDDSLELIGALTYVFNGMSTKCYLDIYFKLLYNVSVDIFPKTYIRVDYANLISN